jgi:hypothetical protein
VPNFNSHSWRVFAENGGNFNACLKGAKVVSKKIDNYSVLMMSDMDASVQNSEQNCTVLKNVLPGKIEHLAMYIIQQLSANIRRECCVLLEIVED